MTQIDARSIIPADATASRYGQRFVDIVDDVKNDLFAIGLRLTTLLDDVENAQAAAQVRHALLDIDNAVRHARRPGPGSPSLNRAALDEAARAHRTGDTSSAAAKGAEDSTRDRHRDLRA